MGQQPRGGGGVPRAGLGAPLGPSGWQMSVQGKSDGASWFCLCASGPAQGCRWFSPLSCLCREALPGDRGMTRLAWEHPAGALSSPHFRSLLSVSPPSPSPSPLLGSAHGQTRTDRCRSPCGVRRAPPSPPLSVAAPWPPVV